MDGWGSGLVSLPRAQGTEMITFQPLSRDHFALLGRWLAEPHVDRWWNHDSSPSGIERDFGGTVDGRDPGRSYVAAYDESPFGLIQFSRFEEHPDYAEEMADVYPVGAGAGSIDYLIGEPSMVGRGLGTEMIERYVDLVWETEPSVSHLVVPVNSDNVGSWQALLKAGFRIVARGELPPDHPDHGRMHEVLRIDRPHSSSR